MTLDASRCDIQTQLILLKTNHSSLGYGFSFTQEFIIDKILSKEDFMKGGKLIGCKDGVKWLVLHDYHLDAGQVGCWQTGRVGHRFSSHYACACCACASSSAHHWRTACCCSGCSWLANLPTLATRASSPVIKATTASSPSA